MKTIAIIAGGNSSEHDVSIKSAAAVTEALKNKYITYTILIEGSRWYAEGEKSRVFKVDRNDFSLETDDGKVNFDAAFIAIHGTPGENGLLQGYFDMLGIPYASCDVLCSALTFNKNACKSFLAQFGVSMADSVMVRKGNGINPEEIISKTGLPCFVKPNESGSSCGVTKVKEVAGLLPALELAFSESKTVIVEAELRGREAACGLAKTRDREIIMPVTEIISKKEFFDYEAKYTPGMSERVTPARFSEEVTQRIQRTASDIYDYLGCRGIVRIDFIVVDDNPFFLEVNTISGMTAGSLIPKQAEAYGITPGDLYSMVIDDLFA
ncbi:MAG: D-alanine--D-alanine ligase [Bacteroidales bacterium]